jgi:hypothetical protein
VARADPLTYAWVSHLAETLSLIFGLVRTVRSFGRGRYIYPDLAVCPNYVETNPARLSQKT